VCVTQSGHTFGVQTSFVSQPTGFPAAVSFQQPGQPPTQQTSQQAKLAFPGAGFGVFSAQPPQPQLSLQPSSLSPIPEDSAASFQNTTPQQTCWKTNSHESTVVTRMMGAYNSGFEMLGAPQK
jgi:hypothetical protein